ncbi:MAG: hypothetical protein SGI86_20745 [Deltaproteobacteria bacterium]|nr:hypothetical protein [Deltaproteobacteria bacterium]
MSNPIVSRKKRFWPWVRLSLGVGVLWATVLTWACASPFIPIPPPGDPTFEPVGDASTAMSWRVSGAPAEALANSRVSIFNQSQGKGLLVQALADGSYVSPSLDAKIGDFIEIFYEPPGQTERSASICRILVEGLSREVCRGLPDSGASD